MSNRSAENEEQNGSLFYIAPFLNLNRIYNCDYQKYFYFSLMYIVSHILTLSLKITNVDKQQVSSLN